MNNKTVLLPGVFVETCDVRNRVTVEGIVEKVLLANGYPVVGNTCNQPDICTLVSACAGDSDPLCFENGLLTGEDNCTRLGGELTIDTLIDTATFGLNVEKDNVKLEIGSSGGSFGAGEVSRFIGVDSDVVAEVGVYTNGGGIPSVGSRTSKTSTGFYSQGRHNTTLDHLTMRAGATPTVEFMHTTLTPDTATFGWSDAVGPNMVISVGAQDIIQLFGLQTHANNAAAVGAGLPVDTVYKTAGGELRIVV